MWHKSVNPLNGTRPSIWACDGYFKGHTG
ncbi:hypothetical protein F383_30182 [Gossypium arboreum]|uniref:Uncharacterized protein n=1 Tax=Gossypium arboreum TaxID=29729 RepID=A0A0B0PDN2_GOSAR|nr:hypothetical protein F383_30182 [Gossypium arboreum]